MKKTKLICLTAVLLLAAMLLCACGGTIGNVDAVLNPDHVDEEYLYDTEKALSELSGYTVTAMANDLIVFANTEDVVHTTYKVFNLADQKIVAEFTDTTLSYTVTPAQEVAAFLVTSIEIEVEEGVEAETVYTLYDAQGKKVTSTKYNPGSINALRDDKVIYDYALYTVEANGAFTKVADIPETLAMGSIYAINDKYLYASSGNLVILYNYEFKPVATYSAPSYATALSSNALNNGKLVVQYEIALTEDATDYDFEKLGAVGNAVKYDLVTVLINPENGEAKEIDVAYKIANVLTHEWLYDKNDKNNEYNDKFQNIAWIYRIEDKRMDESQANMDVVLMNNDANAENSLKMVDGQAADIPHFVTDGVYSVAMLNGGKALIDASGKVLNYINNSNVTLQGDYLIGQRAIYDINMTKLYDKVENEGDVVASAQDTLYIKETTDNGYVVKALYNGTLKTIYTFDEDAEENESIGYLSGVGYYIVNSAGTEYIYYNAAGAKIISLSYALKVEDVSNDGDVVLVSGMLDSKSVFHTLTVK